MKTAPSEFSLPNTGQTERQALIASRCLKHSRAIRLVWLTEDMHLPHDLVMHDRTEDFHAPQSLAKLHLLGKSPVIKNAGLVLAQFATCLRHLTNKFDGDTHRAKKGNREHLRHEELLDDVESSFALATMGRLLPKIKGEEPSQEARAAVHKNLNCVAQQLTPNGLLFGKTATLADIHFSHPLANLSSLVFLDGAPRSASHWVDLQQPSGYKAAVAKAGPMAPPS